MAIIKCINDLEFKKLYDKPGVLLINIRVSDEYHYEHLSNAVSFPPFNFDLAKINKLAKEKIVIIHGQSGSRTKISKNLFCSINADEIFILEYDIVCLKGQCFWCRPHFFWYHRILGYGCFI